MSMFERQSVTLKKKEIDAHELINGVVNTFRLKVEKNNGTLEAELNAQDPVILWMKCILPMWYSTCWIMQ